MNTIGATSVMISVTTEIYKLLSNENVFKILEELDLEFDIRLISHVFTSIGEVSGILLFCKTEIEKLIKKIKSEIEQIHIKTIDKQWTSVVASWRITFTENIENLKKYKSILNNRKKAFLQLIELSNSAAIAKGVNLQLNTHVEHKGVTTDSEIQKVNQKIEKLFE